jgi:hypothetical protein
MSSEDDHVAVGFTRETEDFGDRVAFREMVLDNNRGVC